MLLLRTLVAAEVRERSGMSCTVKIDFPIKIVGKCLFYSLKIKPICTKQQNKFLCQRMQQNLNDMMQLMNVPFGAIELLFLEGLLVLSLASQMHIKTSLET